MTLTALAPLPDLDSIHSHSLASAMASGCILADTGVQFDGSIN